MARDTAAPVIKADMDALEAKIDTMDSVLDAILVSIDAIKTVIEDVHDSGGSAIYTNEIA